MRKLLTLSALLFSFNGWAEEYPIKLSCEVGAMVITVNLEEDSNNSYWFIRDNDGSIQKRMEKKRNVRYQELDDSVIKVGIGFGELFINRLSGNFTLRGKAWHGECFKGFKEYNEKKF